MRCVAFLFVALELACVAPTHDVFHHLLSRLLHLRAFTLLVVQPHSLPWLLCCSLPVPACEQKLQLLVAPQLADAKRALNAEAASEQRFGFACRRPLTISLSLLAISRFLGGCIDLRCLQCPGSPSFREQQPLNVPVRIAAKALLEQAAADSERRESLLTEELEDLKRKAAKARAGLTPAQQQLLESAESASAASAPGSASSPGSAAIGDGAAEAGAEPGTDGDDSGGPKLIDLGSVAVGPLRLSAAQFVCVTLTPLASAPACSLLPLVLTLLICDGVCVPSWPRCRCRWTRATCAWPWDAWRSSWVLRCLSNLFPALPCRVCSLLSMRLCVVSSCD